MFSFQHGGSRFHETYASHEENIRRPILKIHTVQGFDLGDIFNMHSALLHDHLSVSAMKYTTENTRRMNVNAKEPYGTRYTTSIRYIKRNITIINIDVFVHTKVNYNCDY